MNARHLSTLLRQDPTVALDPLGEHASELRSTRARTVVRVCNRSAAACDTETMVRQFLAGDSENRS